MQMYKYTRLVFFLNLKKNGSSRYTWKSDHMCFEKTSLPCWLQSYPKLCLPGIHAIIEDNHSKQLHSWPQGYNFKLENTNSPAHSLS